MSFIKVIELRKVFQTYSNKLEILKGINMEISQGEMVCVVGTSGVGKSTLLHILGTLDKPTSGKVLYEGKEVFNLDDTALASFRNSKIGFIFQSHHLMSEFSALENVMMPGLINGLPYKQLRKRAEELLETLHLSDRAEHKPGELSGGQQQRVAVARALIMEPIVVLADEPTGNLDTKTGWELFQLLKKLNKQKGITFIIVTHNYEIAKTSDRILKMVDGKLYDYIDCFPSK